MKTFDNFQSAYLDCINEVLYNGNDVTVRSENMREKIFHGFILSNPRERLLNIPSRKNMYRYIFGELLWYLDGNDSVEFIDSYSSMWKTLSDDGEHSNSAYGKYLFKPMHCKGEGVNYDNDNNLKSQWDYVKELLRKDPFTRQAIIHVKPIQMYSTKDVVCTFYLHFFIRDGKLNLIVNMRSNDLMFGTPYDVFMFTFMQELMSVELGIELGSYYHIANNMHIYHKNLEKLRIVATELSENPRPNKLSKIPKKFRHVCLKKILAYVNTDISDQHYVSKEPIIQELLDMYKGKFYEKFIRGD